MRAPLLQRAAFRAAAPPAALEERLRALVEPHPGGFTLVHRLSDGGAVVRSLRAPATALPLFGEVGGGRFRLALVPVPSDISPFQPILRGELHPDGGGSRLVLTLRPHPDVHTHQLLFLLLAGVVILGSMVRGLEAPGQALAGFAFAALAVAFPSWRARHSFGQGCAAARARLAALLELEPLPDPGPA